MSVDKETIHRIAHSARLTLKAEEVDRMCAEINALLNFDEQLNEVDIDGVEPLVSVIDAHIKLNADKINENDQAALIVDNAPLAHENFFLVPKVVD